MRTVATEQTPATVAPDTPGPRHLGHHGVHRVEPLLEREHEVARNLHPVPLDPVDTAAAVAGRHQVKLGEVVEVHVAEVRVAAAEPGGDPCSDGHGTAGRAGGYCSVMQALIDAMTSPYGFGT